MLPISVSILLMSVSKPSPADAATPSPIPCFSTGGLIGLVTALPGSVSSSAEIAPRALSWPPTGLLGDDCCVLAKEAPSNALVPSGVCCCLALAGASLSAILGSATVVRLFAPSTWKPRNAPRTIGNCASSPSRKKPNTHDPHCNSDMVPVFLVCGLSVGSKTFAQGSTLVGTSLI